MHKTQVLITIDTEFSIAGALNPSLNVKPVADPVVCGTYKGKEQGLGFLLETFARFNTKAVFFVEAINQCHFGLEPMGRLVERIAPLHDVQLHTHPVWAAFDRDVVRRDRPLFPVNDSLLGRSAEQVGAILDIGLNTFEAWGLPAPIAIRTGSLLVEPALYPAFLKQGLRWSSSIGVGIYRPSDSYLNIEHGVVNVEGVKELPVTSFIDMPRLRPAHRKTLQVTSCSWPEMRAVLNRAHQEKIDQVVILTHPFEYFKRKDYRFAVRRPNRVNQQRLVSLCRFLDENRDRFESTDFRTLDQGVRDAPETSERSLSLSSPSDVLALARMGHNKFNDVVWWY